MVNACCKLYVTYTSTFRCIDLSAMYNVNSQGVVVEFQKGLRRGLRSRSMALLYK